MLSRWRRKNPDSSLNKTRLHTGTHAHCAWHQWCRRQNDATIQPSSSRPASHTRIRTIYDENGLKQDAGYRRRCYRRPDPLSVLLRRGIFGECYNHVVTNNISVKILFFYSRRGHLSCIDVASVCGSLLSGVRFKALTLISWSQQCRRMSVVHDNGLMVLTVLPWFGTHINLIPFFLLHFFNAEDINICTHIYKYICQWTYVKTINWVSPR